ncbi:hypothetical protein MTO96_013287 [Rhipicephalus appendiculatus]
MRRRLPSAGARRDTANYCVELDGSKDCPRTSPPSGGARYDVARAFRHFDEVGLWGTEISEVSVVPNEALLRGDYR